MLVTGHECFSLNLHRNYSPYDRLRMRLSFLGGVFCFRSEQNEKPNILQKSEKKSRKFSFSDDPEY